MSTASGLLSSLFADLDTKEKDEEYTKVRVDCRPTSNLDSIVRSIVIGLLEGQKEVDFTVDPPTLPTLFGHLPSSPSPPILLIALHQTHLLPTPLLPQLVHVLNRYTAKFVLVLTTAAAGSSTSSTGMEGLDTRSFELPNGSEVWEAVVEAVWFPLSGDREEEVFVGVDGDTLEELRVGFERVEGSLEGLISQIQVRSSIRLQVSR
ncbi:hypothetical protein BDY24DRAFT_223338 [Mrakia frigida]|uniref:uncharacterized protein n=1 Tax=Mrakia frigida TaxID=29902 RepID=UPI003FCC1D8E